MTLARQLGSLRLPLVVVLIGVGLALFERHQTEASDHLATYGADGLPQLRGDSLGAFADQALALWPQTAQPRVLKAMALAEAGRLERARALLEEALAINRRNPMLLHLYARVLEAQREDPERVRELREELRRYFPRDWEELQRSAAERG